MRHPLLHPVALGALALLVVNDHVLKRVCPSFLTGKLSDVAGVFVLPLVISAAFEVFAPRAFRERRAHAQVLARVTERAANRALFAAVVATMLVFSAVELWTPAETFYRYSIGVMQWPFRAAVALLRSVALPGVAPVSATADATDLVALPMGLVAYAFGARRARSAARVPHRQRARRTPRGFPTAQRVLFRAACRTSPRRGLRASRFPLRDSSWSLQAASLHARPRRALRRLRAPSPSRPRTCRS